ncbi:MAG: hypothetical protein LBG97_03515 [Coriobacteriales bacterium]|jgi:hypothetical protein|nr:hypothetical protein [Coriobacteriales bacterium]
MIGFGLPELIVLAIMAANLVLVVFVARYARKNKNFSFWLVLALGIFTSFVVQLILVLLLPARVVSKSSAETDYVG